MSPHVSPPPQLYYPKKPPFHFIFLEPTSFCLTPPLNSQFYRPNSCPIFPALLSWRWSGSRLYVWLLLRWIKFSTRHILFYLQGRCIHLWQKGYEINETFWGMRVWEVYRAFLDLIRYVRVLLWQPESFLGNSWQKPPHIISNKGV